MFQSFVVVMFIDFLFFVAMSQQITLIEMKVPNCIVTLRIIRNLKKRCY